MRAWFRRSVDSSLKTSEDPILVDRVARVLHRAEMVKDWISYELLMAPNTKLAAIYIEKFILLAKVRVSCSLIILVLIGFRPFLFLEISRLRCPLLIP